MESPLRSEWSEVFPVGSSTGSRVDILHATTNFLSVVVHGNYVATRPSSTFLPLSSGHFLGQRALPSVCYCRAVGPSRLLLSSVFFLEWEVW